MGIKETSNYHPLTSPVTETVTSRNETLYSHENERKGFPLSSPGTKNN